MAGRVIGDHGSDLQSPNLIPLGNVLLQPKAESWQRLLAHKGTCRATEVNVAVRTLVRMLMPGCRALFDSADHGRNPGSSRSPAGSLHDSRRPFSQPPQSPPPRRLPIALGGNLTCALLLKRYRHHGGSLMRAAFLSARNDALANIAVAAAGLVTAFVWSTAWLDLAVGLAIAALNVDAAREIWDAAREEHEGGA